MMFPALDAFDADARPSRRHARVYRYLRSVLDFQEPRASKLALIEHETGVSKGNLSSLLADLVTWGYLTEHERDTYGGRRFTLAWSLKGSESAPVVFASMVFPARAAFDADPRVRLGHLRVYRDACTHLDFVEPRSRKIEAIAAAVGGHATHINRALLDLVTWGYVADRGRDGRARLLVLSWNVTKNVTTKNAAAA